MHSREQVTPFKAWGVGGAHVQKHQELTPLKEANRGLHFGPVEPEMTGQYRTSSQLTGQLDTLPAHSMVQVRGGVFQSRRFHVRKRKKKKKENSVKKIVACTPEKRPALKNALSSITGGDCQSEAPDQIPTNNTGQETAGTGYKMLRKGGWKEDLIRTL